MLGISCEYSARQTIHIQCQTLFSLNNNNKKKKNKNRLIHIQCQTLFSLNNNNKKKKNKNRLSPVNNLLGTLSIFLKHVGW